MTSLYSLAVGELYHPDRASWPDGVSEYTFDGNGHELKLFIGAPTTRYPDSAQMLASAIARCRGGA